MLENLREVFIASGVGFAQVVKTTVFLVNSRTSRPSIESTPSISSLPNPARSTVQVSALPTPCRVEIEAIARRSTIHPEPYFAITRQGR